MARREDSAAAELLGYERPLAGFSSETFLVDVRRAGAPERLVLKLPPHGDGIFPVYDFALQAAVQEAVAAAGIPAAVPVHVEEDATWVGAPFLVMPAIAGHIVDEVPIADPWLTEAEPDDNALVHGRYLDVVADINRIDWRAAGLGDVVPARDNAAEIAHWRGYLDWYADGIAIVPALVDALDWCDAHRPATDPAPSLRVGRRAPRQRRSSTTRRIPIAVLDWEMASIGSAEHDLAWSLVARGGDPAELFAAHGPGVPRPRRRGGALRGPARAPACESLWWYEILALVRSTAIMTRIAHLGVLAGRTPLLPIADNPFLDILARRIGEAGA